MAIYKFYVSNNIEERRRIANLAKPRGMLRFVPG
jgi:hypothetical protein